MQLIVGRQSVAVALPPNGPTVPPLADAIVLANTHARIEGLPDTLNPDMIDTDKAAAFVAGLSGQRAETIALIAGHRLSLLAPGLGLSAAAPTRAAAFEAGFTLVVDEVRSRTVIAHTSVSADPDLARDRSQHAEKALRAAEASVREAEAGRDIGRIGAARLLRAAAASAWRMNASAWVDTMPNDRDARRAQAAAQSVARAYAMPRGGLAG